MREEFNHLEEFYEVKDKKTLEEFVEYGWSPSTSGKFVLKVGDNKALYFYNTGQYGVDVAVKIGDEIEEFENLSYDNAVEFLVTVGLMYRALKESSTIEEFLDKANYAYAGRAVKAVLGDGVDDELLELLAPWSEFYGVFGATVEDIHKLVRKIDEMKAKATDVQDAVIRLYDHNVNNVWEPGDYYLITGAGVSDEDYVAELLELAKSIVGDIKEDWTYEDVLDLLEEFKAFSARSVSVIDVEL